MTTTARARNGPAFGRQRLPERFCNLDRLLAGLEARDLDGLVVTSALNVFYLTGFNGVAHKADEPRPYTLDPCPARARASDPGARRLLPHHPALPADVGEGHPPLPLGDVAGGPAAPAGGR